MTRSQVVDAMSDQIYALAEKLRAEIAQILAKSVNQAIAYTNQQNKQTGKLPAFRGVRGWLRSLLYGHHKDNPDYRDYNHVPEHISECKLTLKEYVEITDKINEVVKEISREFREYFQTGLDIGDELTTKFKQFEVGAKNIIRSNMAALGGRKRPAAVPAAGPTPAEPRQNAATGTPPAPPASPPHAPTPAPAPKAAPQPPEDVTSPVGSVDVSGQGATATATEEKPQDVAAQATPTSSQTPLVSPTNSKNRIRKLGLVINEKAPRFISEQEKQRLISLVDDVAKKGNGYWLADKFKNIKKDKVSDAIELLKKNNVPIESVDPKNISDKDIEVISYVFGFPPTPTGTDGARKLAVQYIAKERPVPNAPKAPKKAAQKGGDIEPDEFSDQALHGDLDAFGRTIRGD